MDTTEPKITLSKRIKQWIFGAMHGASGTPTEVGAHLPLSPTPEGLALAYTAEDYSQAALLRQLLEQEGFHPEWVSSFTTGAFGINDSPNVYVHAEECEPARAFIEEYLNGEVIVESDDEPPQ